MIKEWQNAICPIHHVINGLEHCNCKPPFFLLSFPTKDLKLRDEWIKRINRKDWQLTYYHRICSTHFVDPDFVKKKPSPAFPYPTQNMGYSMSGERAKQKRKAPPTRKNSPPPKQKYVKKLNVPCPEDKETESSSVIQCEDCDKYKQQIKQLKKELHYWQTLCLKKQHKPFSIQILKDNAKVKTYTGLPSKEVFDGLFDSFGNKVKKIRKWKGPAQHRQIFSRKNKSSIPFINAKEEYFIALFHMKTMLKAEIVGDLFGISRTTVSQICLTWWKFMARELKPLLDNPSEEAHRALLPASFQTPQYNKVQHIIDCTEVYTETPKNKESSVGIVVQLQTSPHF